MKRNAPGYTILELLVVMATIAVLVSLIFPTVSRVRAQARDLGSLANLRTHAQVLSMYSIDWNDSFIHFTRREATQTILESCGVRSAYRYFENSAMWHRAVAEDYYSCGSPAFAYPGADPGGWHYLLTAAAIARPPYWDLETRTGGAQWATSRLTQVAFPGAKAAFIELKPGGAIPAPLAADDQSFRYFGFSMIDGSAGRFSHSQLQTPVATGDGTFHDQFILPYGWYGVHTPDGVLGRDVKSP